MKRKLACLLVLSMILSLFSAMVYVNAAATKTKEEAVAWINSRVGKRAADMDGRYAAQCVDLIQEYYSFLGVSGGGGNACDYSRNTRPKDFTRIQNYYGFVPEAGDIAVWSKGWYGGANGHVGIVIAADLYSVTVADVFGSESKEGIHYKSDGTTITTEGVNVRKTTYSPYSGGNHGCTFWGVIRPKFAEKVTVAESETVTTKTEAAKIAEGNYYIISSDRYLNAPEDWDGGNVNAVAKENTKAQQFKIYKNGDNYNIESLNGENRELNVYTSGSSVAGKNVTLWQRTNNPTQRWIFVKNGSSYIIHPSDNMALALTAQEDGNVNIAEYTGAKNQLWKLKKVSEKAEKKEQVMILGVGLPTMKIGDKSYEIDPGKNTTPIVMNGRTLVPIRAIVEAMDGTVKWNGDKQKITIEANDHKIIMWIGETTVSVDGDEEELDVAPVIINGRTMIPLRFVAEGIGCDVEWVASRQEIIITFE